MKGKKLRVVLIFLIIVLVLIVFFTTKILVNKHINSNYYKKLLEKETWVIVKTEYLYDNYLTTYEDTGLSFSFNNGNLRICGVNGCNDTLYTLKNNKLKIDKYGDESFYGLYEVDYQNELLGLKMFYEDNGYVKYYLDIVKG